MFPEDAVEDALSRLTKLEMILDELLTSVAQATDLAEINVAAGIAHDRMHGVEN